MATTPNLTQVPPLEAPLAQEVLSHLYSLMLKARLLAKRWRNAPQMSEAILAASLQNAEPTDLLVSAGVHPILEVLSGTAVVDVEPRLRKATNEPPKTRVIFAGKDAAAGVASGLALALKSASSSALVIVIVSASVTRGAAWEQATEFAAANRLPIVFVSDGTGARSMRRHEGSELSHWPFPTIAVDGRDVIAVYRVAKEAIAAARRGHGPTLVDCVNFVAPGGRGKDNRDPLISFRGYLKRHNAWQEEWAKGLEAALAAEISAR